MKSENLAVAGAVVLVVAAIFVLFGLPSTTPDVPPTRLYIVQAGSAGAAAEAVLAVGGEITQELTVIRAVGAELTPGQASALLESKAVTRVHPGRGDT